MAITSLLQNIFQKAFFIACQDLTNDTGFSSLKRKTIFGLTSLIRVLLMGVAMDTEPYPVLAGLLIRKAVTWRFRIPNAKWQ